MNLLFVCSTEYQILNAVNIKLNMHLEDYADIIVETTGSKQNRFVKELKVSDLFGNVLYKKNPSLGVHDYIRYLRNSEEYPCVGISEAISSDIHDFIINVQCILNDEVAKVNDLVEGFSSLDYKKYDIMFAQGNNLVVNNLYKLLKRNTDCKMAILDEGIGSYYLDTIGNRNTIADMAYVYAPDICNYYENSDIEFRKIPAIKSSDTILINIMNKIFNYMPHQCKFDSRLIMFDQGCQKMPEYLKNLSGIKNILLRNTYKKHLPEGIMYESQIGIFKLISEKYKALSPIVKLHPRPAEGIRKDYINANIEIMNTQRVPWELVCANENVSNSFFVTICSSAVFLIQFNVENMKDHDIIFLYKMINLPIPKACEVFFNNYKKRYGDRIHIPENEQELVDIIDTIYRRLYSG